MTDSKKPAMPPGLEPAGKRVWRRVVDGFELDPHEVVLLEQAARQADLVASLEKALRKDGPMAIGSQGQQRVSQLVPAISSARLALAKLLGELALPDQDEDVGLSPASKRAQHAAQRRWSGNAGRRGRYPGRVDHG